MHCLRIAILDPDCWWAEVSSRNFPGFLVSWTLGPLGSTPDAVRPLWAWEGSPEWQHGSRARSGWTRRCRRAGTRRRWARPGRRRRLCRARRAPIRWSERGLRHTSRARSLRSSARFLRGCLTRHGYRTRVRALATLTGSKGRETRRRSSSK